MYLENNQIRRYPLRAWLAWTAAVAWMAVIFLFSHQTGDVSGRLSYSLAELVVRIIDRQAGLQMIRQTDSVLRVVAHVASYFTLGLLVAWAFSEIGIRDLRNAVLTFFICVLYAASDELHQAYVPGRTGQFSDFLIDAAGILLSILCYQLVGTVRYLRQELQVRREEDLRL